MRSSLRVALLSSASSGGGGGSGPAFQTSLDMRDGRNAASLLLIFGDLYVDQPVTPTYSPKLDYRDGRNSGFSILFNF